MAFPASNGLNQNPNAPDLVMGRRVLRYGNITIVSPTHGGDGNGNPNYGVIAMGRRGHIRCFNTPIRTLDRINV
jgi:hypothetical protein